MRGHCLREIPAKGVSCFSAVDVLRPPPYNNPIQFPEEAAFLVDVVHGWDGECVSRLAWGFLRQFLAFCNAAFREDGFPGQAGE
jgi:hypothetical protein